MEPDSPDGNGFYLDMLARMSQASQSMNVESMRAINSKQTQGLQAGMSIRSVAMLKKPAELLRSTIFLELPNSIKGKPRISGAFLFECDAEYNPTVSPCFSMRLSWIFATSLQMLDTIKGIQRRAKECDFDMIPISGIAQKDALNPFENPTELRPACKMFLNIQKLQQVDIQQPLLEEQIQIAEMAETTKQGDLEQEDELHQARDWQNIAK